MLTLRDQDVPRPRRLRLPNRWHVARNRIANRAFAQLQREWDEGGRPTVRSDLLRRFVTASRPLQHVAVRSLAEAPASRSATLLPGAVVPSVGATVGNVPVSATGQLPALVRLHLRDAQVNPWSSSVVVGRNVYMERALGPSAAMCSQEAGHVVIHGTKSALVRSGPEESIRRGFFLGGNGAFNYYHWLVEILPKLQFLTSSPELDELPLLVPAEVRRISAMRESLGRLAPGREVIHLESELTYRVADLVYVTSINSCPFNLRPGQTYGVGDFAYRRDSLEFLRQALAEEMHQGANAPGRSRRLFLARGTERRGYNQDEIVEICIRHGFDVVRPEARSFEDQVKLFAGADFIVGPSGAAWANVVFASPGVQCLTWLPDAFREFAVYSNLTRLAGGELSAMTYAGAPGSTGALYEHEYILDPLEFESELTSLLAAS